MTDCWTRLEENRENSRDRRILSLFSDDRRLQSFAAETDGMFLDFSKTNIDMEALSMLLELAKAAGLAEKRDAMFRGDRINSTENRSVLHTALRSSGKGPLVVDGRDVMPDVETTLEDMSTFANGVRAGLVTSASGDRFADVVNIGIGGSDLGPAMATRALAPYRDGPRCHFVSNVDGAHVTDTLRKLDPATTLIVIASKTFTTIETMTNAATALGWLRSALGEDVSGNLAAVSSALDMTSEMGVPSERVFGFADWVGGRYSLWGPVGLPVMLAIGPDDFRDFLSGGAAMDAHFRSAPFERNLPVLMGLVGVWHRNVCRYPARAVIPYDQRLARLPAYLQQLDMESNGKRVAIDGRVLEQPSGPVVWGEPGTNGQHAFFQLLHQGTQVTPVEFLLAAEGHEADLEEHHDLLKANCLAQAEALMVGRSFDQALEVAAGLGFEGPARHCQAAHRTFPGNRPSTTLVYPRLTPFTLGQIIALHEHRVFVEGAIWGINSFDQWGVELGKELAKTLLPMVQGLSERKTDPSTRELIRRLAQRPGK